MHVYIAMPLSEQDSPTNYIIRRKNANKRRESLQFPHWGKFTKWFFTCLTHSDVCICTFFQCVVIPLSVIWFSWFTPVLFIILIPPYFHLLQIIYLLFKNVFFWRNWNEGFEMWNWNSCHWIWLIRIPEMILNRYSRNSIHNWYGF